MKLSSQTIKKDIEKARNIIRGRVKGKVITTLGRRIEYKEVMFRRGSRNIILTFVRDKGKKNWEFDSGVHD